MKTDAQVQEDVLAELKWEPSVNAAKIGVEVKDGIVTLAGHVESDAERWDAERASQRVAGARALAIEIDVALRDRAGLALGRKPELILGTSSGWKEAA